MLVDIDDPHERSEVLRLLYVASEHGAVVDIGEDRVHIHVPRREGPAVLEVGSIGEALSVVGNIR